MNYAEKGSRDRLRNPMYLPSIENLKKEELATILQQIFLEFVDYSPGPGRVIPCSDLKILSWRKNSTKKGFDISYFIRVTFLGLEKYRNKIWKTLYKKNIELRFSPLKGILGLEDLNPAQHLTHKNKAIRDLSREILNIEDV